MNTPMTRREEVEAEVNKIFILTGAWHAGAKELEALAKTLAEEVDILRASLLALGKKAERFEKEREINAGLVVERDAVIDKLLTMLESETLKGIKRGVSREGVLAHTDKLHARACEIAGREK